MRCAHALATMRYHDYIIRSALVSAITGKTNQIIDMKYSYDERFPFFFLSIFLACNNMTSQANSDKRHVESKIETICYQKQNER